MAASKKAWRRRVGRVTVYQRGGRFWIYYRDCTPVRRPVGTSREEALAVAAKINAQLADGGPTLLAFQPIAVTAMIAKWLDHHEHVRRSAVNTVISNEPNKRLVRDGPADHLRSLPGSRPVAD